MRKQSWSFSSLLNFEKCPMSVSFPYRAIDNEFTTRGTQIHNELEQFLRDTSRPRPTDLGDAFKPESLRERAPNAFLIEPEIGVTKDWELTEYRGAWAKIKPDVMYIDHEYVDKDAGEVHVHVIDFKSGKRFGNELKHGSQIQLYLCGGLAMYPMGASFSGELWYVDHNLIVPVGPFSRDRIVSMQARWSKRGQAMLDCEDFRPKPSKSNCKYCFERDRCDYAYEQ